METTLQAQKSWKTYIQLKQINSNLSDSTTKLSIAGKKTWFPKNDLSDENNVRLTDKIVHGLIRL